MTAQFRWAESDYVAAQLAWLRHHPWPLARGFLRYPIAILFITVAIVAKHPDSWKRGSAFIFISLGVIGFSIVATRWRWHRRFKRTTLWHNNITATVDQEGINLRGQGFEVRRSWDEFSEIYESSSVFLFRTASKRLVFLPKREMSQSQMHELRNTILSYARVKPRLATEMV